MKNIVMTRLLSTVTKRSFFGVTTLMACRSFETLFWGLNTRVSYSWHTDAKKLNVATIFLYQKAHFLRF